MMVIIHGEDRSEYCSVKKKFKEKHFFETRLQTYRMMPEGMSRMLIDYFGEKSSDEVIVYAENEIWPYIMKGNIDYSKESFMMEIDMHKGMTKGGWFGAKAKLWFKGGAGGDLKKYIRDPSTWGIILAIIIGGPILIGGLL